MKDKFYEEFGTLIIIIAVFMAIAGIVLCNELVSERAINLKLYSYINEKKYSDAHRVLEEYREGKQKAVIFKNSNDTKIESIVDFYYYSSLGDILYNEESYEEASEYYNLANSLYFRGDTNTHRVMKQNMERIIK